jgi:hypothetical protein
MLCAAEMVANASEPPSVRAIGMPMAFDISWGLVFASLRTLIFYKTEYSFSDSLF